MPKRLNLIGQTFGQLTVFALASTSGKTVWDCQCACGKTTRVVGSNLKTGSTISCGCVRQARKVKHGHHGSSTYFTWREMRARCNNHSHSRYHDYGGRGIGVCARWALFTNFLDDMGERPEGLTLDRINNDEGYLKENCRWATYSEQNSNKRPNRQPAGAKVEENIL
jgi:hypothetical protein